MRRGLSARQFYSHCVRLLEKNGLDYDSCLIPSYQEWADGDIVESQEYRARPFEFWSYCAGEWSANMEYDFDAKRGYEIPKKYYYCTWDREYD